MCFLKWKSAFVGESAIHLLKVLHNLTYGSALKVLYLTLYLSVSSH